MLIARAFTFLLFLMLALGMVAWQVNHVAFDVAQTDNFRAVLFILFGGPALLFAEFLAFRALREQNDTSRNVAYAVAGAVVLPLTALVAGSLSAIMARGGNHKRIWASTLSVGALIGLNGVVAAGTGFVGFGGGQTGLALGLACVKVQFFLVVDYFLISAILRYFGSAASAFISLRYLRQRVISLLSVGGIATGVWVLIVVNSIMTGFQKDFREQIRGSSSHVLVRFDAEQFHPRGSVRDMLQWQEYVKRINAEPEYRTAWEQELGRASSRAQVEGLDADAMLERLKTGRDLSSLDLKFLRDGNKATTARDFYLERKAGGDTDAAKRARETIDEEAKQAWFYPEFRRRMAEAFEGTEKVLKAHKNAAGEKDVVGVSWRVSVKAVITPKNRVSDLPIAELTGVDLERETSISNLGDYIATAESQYFKVRYVLHPLQQVLGALLGFETRASVEKLAQNAEFRFTPTGLASDAGPVSQPPMDLRRLLKSRRIAASTDKLSWESFDEVRFWGSTPGQKLYDVAKEAYKRALRTYDLDELSAIAREAHIALRAILEAELAKPPGSTDEEQLSRMGCRIILDHYLTSLGVCERQMRALKSQFVDATAALIRDETRVLPEDKDWAMALHAALVKTTEEHKTVITDPAVDEAAREAALLNLAKTYIRQIAQAIEQGEKDGRLSAMEFKQAFTLKEENAEGLLPYSEQATPITGPRALPLAYAVGKLDSRMKLVRQRQDAYRKVIPLRTSMYDNESAQTYMARARQQRRPEGGDLPGIILGEALAESAFFGGVDVGDEIALTIPRIYRTEDGRLMPNAIEARFRVTGFFRSGLYEDNLGRMYCDFDELARILMDSDVRYIVGAKFKDYTPYEGEINSLKLKNQLYNELREGGVYINSRPGVWEDEKKSLLEAVNREKMIVSLIVGFILFLAGALIMIVVYQLVSEKVKDIGILKALGHSPWGIRSVFMFNALFIGLFGATAGSLIGITFSQYLNEIEDFIDRVTGIRLFPPDIYFLTYIPSVKGLDLVWLAINIAVPAVLWSFACGILPALSAARKDPIEALHHE
ncbi:MAG: FtsX-like permease family protein [Planctomycetes bacterium]|nr:FtsX-like permease family protein [Planctomycetota bacterium]